MNAISHAATAMVIKKRWPKTPFIPILISVQFIEIIWVILNFIGIEQSYFNSEVLAVNDIQLSYMPFSHSVLSSIVIVMAISYVLYKIERIRFLTIPIALGLLSHIILDIGTHVTDIEIIPFLNLPKIGLGIYAIPLLAFFVEIFYCILCWRYIKGSTFTLIALIILNLLGVSFYFASLTGPESLFSEYKHIFELTILLHIIFGLVSIWWLQKREDERA